MSICFNVDDVKSVGKEYSTKLFIKVPGHLENHAPSFFGKSSSKVRNSLLESSVKNPIIHGEMYNSLLECWSEAYNTHTPLQITSAQIKLHLLRQLAIHVNQNEWISKEKVASTEKVVLNYEVDISPNWPELVDKFSKGMESNILDKELINYVNTTYKSSSNESIVASKIVMMDIFQKHFEYKCYTMCGIPKINLVGSTSEWLEIKSFVNYLTDKCYFDWWTSHLLPIIDEFVNASQGKVNTEFWQNMVKKSGGSGGPYYSGWVKYLFPYLDEGDAFKQSKFGETITLGSVPSGLSKVPVEWTCLGRQRKCEFYGGFLGYKYDGAYLEPNIGWFVSESFEKINSKLEEALSVGTWLEPANHKYGEDKYVVCDFCENHHLDKCVSHERTDVCVSCIKKALDLGSENAKKFKDHL
jgi:hypothetical protein